MQQFKISLSHFIFIIIIFLLPFSVKAQVLNQDSPEGLIESMEKAFMQGNYTLYEESIYYSPTFLSNLSTVQKISWAEYQECSNRIYIASHKIILDELYTPEAMVDKVEIINQETLSTSTVRLEYKIHYLGKTFFNDAIEPKIDESWFIKRQDKWYLDIEAEYNNLEKKYPRLEYCPQMYKQAIDLSNKSGLYAVWVLRDGKEVRYKVGDQSYDVIIATDRGLLIEVGDLVGDIYRYWIHIKNSFPADSLLNSEAFRETKNRIFFVKSLIELLDQPPGGYYDDIQSGEKRLTLWIDDYTKNNFTFQIERDYYSDEERLSGRLGTYSGGRPMVVTIDLAKNTVQETYNQEIVDTKQESIDRADKAKQKRWINQLLSDIPILLFAIFLFSIFSYFLNYLFVKHKLGVFIFHWLPLLTIILLSALISLICEFFIHRYVQLGFADLAVRYLGWPFGLFYGIFVGYFMSALATFILSLLAARYFLKNKWAYSFLFAFSLTFFVAIFSYLVFS